MRILLIEDEPRIRAFLARGFAADGYVVDEAGDGASGLAQALEREYDLIVLDLLLPRLDGLRVMRSVAEQRPGTPVLILSARADLGTKLTSFALGACDYMSKPFSLDELLARARVQVRRRAPFGSDGNVLHVGQLTLDLARHAASVEGDAADLTAREFALLYHLALHAGEVVSRERLLSDVWGYHFDPRSNVVDVCIRRVRKKLGSRAPIETVRHAGYRLPAA
jgi:two-component system, OmpR family, copper resistance phosphate regulon response regulator CusR